MRFDRATELLTSIHAGRVSSRDDAARIHKKDPVTIWRWLRELAKHGVVVDQDRQPWRIKAFGKFRRPEKGKK